MQDAETETAVESARSHNLLQAAQKRREKRESHLFLDIPSWNGDMIGEYRIIPKEQFDKIAARVASKLRSNDKDTTVGDVELIVHSCVALHMRDPESGERIPIEDEFGVVSFNRIASVLGVNDAIQSTTEAVRYLTAERDDNGGWTENVEAINRHAQRISNWMRDPSKRTIDIQDLLSELG